MERIGMAKQPPIKPAQEDGTWFLEAVGAKAPSPSSIESVAELTRENAIPELDAPDPPDTPDAEASSVDVQRTVLESFDGDPGTSTSTFAPIPVPPPPPPVLAGTTDKVESAPGSDIDPTLLAPALRTRRRFRWPVAIVIAVAILAAGAAVIWLPRAADQDALAIRQINYDATFTVRSYLPTAQGALDAVTNPEATTEQVSTAIPTISTLSSHASSLAEAASMPQPRQLPFMTSARIDELAALQERSAILASDASDIARRLGRGYVYRTSIPELLATGDLPLEASAREINVLAVDLASSLAADAGLLGDLPDDPSLAGVLAVATASVDRYAQWQDEYLAALVAADTDTVSTLIDEIDTLRTDLVSTTTEALVSFRSEMDERILSLADQLDAHLSDLAR
jgi:hypothetical protein